MIRNIIYFIGSVTLFSVSMILYGMLQNTGEIPLEKILIEKNLDLTSDMNLVVDKKAHRLMIYNDTVFVKSYKASLGRSQKDIKSSVEDYVTPIGEYYICSVEKSEDYYRFFKLNFPNKLDAAEAYKNKDISKFEYDKIIESYNAGRCPTNKTRLGANIGIQGIGAYNFIFKNLPFIFNWTNGSISISNEGIDEIFPYVKIGTKVKIVH
ncbi:hypothetical protein MNBD_IGNAVI01-861 [hydrothermal vent metagenome]|uniref:L,D-TPase catalytic domain-containing protein n=1 Tax=hydrothermal vent metagenome TaxID=652676 RepID=A0A3B1CHR3_9ZZZZ